MDKIIEFFIIHTKKNAKKKFTNKQKMIINYIILDTDPNNYMAFYRRGTAFLASGKFKPALQDFARVLELKPDFTSVRDILFFETHIYYHLLN